MNTPDDDFGTGRESTRRCGARLFNDAAEFLPSGTRHYYSLAECYETWSAICVHAMLPTGEAILMSMDDSGKRPYTVTWFRSDGGVAKQVDRATLAECFAGDWPDLSAVSE